MSGIPPHDHQRRLPLLNVLMGLVAIAILFAAGIVLWSVSNSDEKPRQPVIEATHGPLGIAGVEYATPLPTRPPRQDLPPVDWVRPTADPAAIAAALDSPVAAAPNSGLLERHLNPLTIIPARPRSTVITYTVKKGDDLLTIAQRFSLEESTIIWSNDRFYVNAMRVGLELNIMPVDGVYHHVLEPQSIGAIAELYDVDPFTIIDSEFNTLFYATPQSILPEGVYVVVPGGTGSTEPIYWDPGIVMTNTGQSQSSSSGGVSVGASTALFAVGDPGSCGEQFVHGGTPPVGAPIYAKYTISQEFNWVHGGIDLAVPVGTPVFSAGGGTVIFNGLSTWGYGYTVVLAHGSTLTLYGHLNGSFVNCGEIVTPAQNIAVTGNSGRSSGPHLHFEIRGANGRPVNPWDYQSF